MKSWPTVSIPKIDSPTQPLRIFSTHSQTNVEIPFRKLYEMYVCGITPYDSTHLGHAATYLTFDIINRFWRATGGEVNYIQNITDIDDPLLERAKRDGIDWKELAYSQIDLYRSDMTALRILPPEHYEGAVDAIPDVINAIQRLEEVGSAYSVANDKYFEVHKDRNFGSKSHYDEKSMLELFAERGGDPDRLEKRNPLDSLLWLAHRDGEPSWPSPFGEGRPGWHIECAAIALKFASNSNLASIETREEILDIQGGGSDLIFPHHEMSASQVRLLTGKDFAKAYVHAGLIGLDGEKMSKSKGNLVFVSKLIEIGVNPMAIRWALLKRHYQEDYMWKGTETEIAQFELDKISQRLKSSEIPNTDQVVDEIYEAVSSNLHTEKAISAINNWANTSGTGGNSAKLRNVIDALLGIALPA